MAKATKKEEEKVKEKFERPEILAGSTALTRTPCGKMYVTVTKHEGKPVEAFLEMGKGGACYNAIFEAFGRLISKALQHGTPINAIADSLSGISCKGASLQNPSCLSRMAGKLRTQGSGE